MILQPAAQEDVGAIASLVNLGEREGQLLPRSPESIRASLEDWIVAKENGRVVGCGSLVEMSPVLSEIRSLAVAPGGRKQGTGGKIVGSLIDLARARRIPTVFALTRAVPFFEKLGFLATVKENFPEKVWRDCLICPVQHACDEVAVAYSVAAESAGEADSPGWVMVGLPKVAGSQTGRI